MYYAFSVGGQRSQTTYYGIEEPRYEIEPSGIVYIVETLRVVLSCNLDLRYHPFETNCCHMPVVIEYPINKITLGMVATIFSRKHFEMLLTDHNQLGANSSSYFNFSNIIYLHIFTF